MELTCFYDWIKIGALNNWINLQEFRYSSIHKFIEETHKEILPFLDEQSKHKMNDHFSGEATTIFDDLSQYCCELMGNYNIKPLGVIINDVLVIDQGLNKKPKVRLTISFKAMISDKPNTPGIVTDVYSELFFLSEDVTDKIILRNKIESLNFI